MGKGIAVSPLKFFGLFVRKRRFLTSGAFHVVFNVYGLRFSRDFVAYIGYSSDFSIAFSVGFNG